MSRSTDDVAGLYAKVDRAAAAADRVGTVGLVPLTEALLDYLDGLSLQDAALSHPHARLAVRSAAQSATKYYTYRIPNMVPGQCQIPLLDMSVGVLPDDSLGKPSVHDWLQAFELALVCRSDSDADWLRRQRYVLPKEPSVPIAYATALVSLWTRQQWPRNRTVKAKTKADLESVRDVLSQVPDDSAWAPRVRVLQQMIAGKSVELADAVRFHAEHNRRRIAWEVLALASLAYDMGLLPDAPESDLLPRHLLVWSPDEGPTG